MQERAPVIDINLGQNGTVLIRWKTDKLLEICQRRFSSKRGWVFEPNPDSWKKDKLQANGETVSLLSESFLSFPSIPCRSHAVKHEHIREENQMSNYKLKHAWYFAKLGEM